MTPAGIAAAVKETQADGHQPAHVLGGRARPINNGGRAKCFASYMRIHALEATGGRTYSQMGQYLTAQGKETSDKTLAGKDPKTGQPTAQRRAQRVGHRDRAGHGAEHVVLRRERRAVRDHHRHRPAADRHRAARAHHPLDPRAEPRDSPRSPRSRSSPSRRSRRPIAPARGSTAGPIPNAGRRHEGPRLPRPRRAKLGHRPRSRASSIRPTPSCGSTPRRSAAAICTSSRATSRRPPPGTVLGHEASAPSRRSAPP